MNINFILNDLPYKVYLDTLPPDITLNSFIREHAGLTGTKFMCQEGGCGVCVCVVSGKHPSTGEIRTWAVNSCLTLLHTCANWEIWTTEGLGNKRDGYHVIQERLAKMNGTQCGYCSPGFVMNMYGLLKSRGGKVTMQEVENAFGGHVCRCTGYRPILDTMKSFATDSNIKVPVDCQTDIEDLAPKTCPKTGAPCSGSCKNTLTYFKHPDGSEWYWPKSIDDIISTFEKIGDEKYMLVGGNTAHGVYRRQHDIKVYIDVNGVSELKQYSIKDEGLVLGGNLSLTETMNIFQKVSHFSEYKYCEKLYEHFDLIANMSVRNMGTLAGNLMIKHEHNDFPSDVFLTFETLGAEIIIRDLTGKRKLSILEFIGASMKKCVIECIILKPYSNEEYVYDSYKIMSVAQNVHAYVNAGFLLNMNKMSGEVKGARICFGGVDEKYVHAKDVEKILVGKSLYKKEIVVDAINILKKNLKAKSHLPEACVEYKEMLVLSLMYKFLLSVIPKDILGTNIVSGGMKLKRPISSGKQTFELNEENSPISMPTEKHEGLRQTSGEIMYANDVPNQKNQLWAAFVTGKKVGAKVIDIDLSEALSLSGVVGYLSANDIPGKNLLTKPGDLLGLFKEDEPLFETAEIKYYDQPIGMIVADTHEVANRATELIKITYSNTNNEVYPTLSNVLQTKDKRRIYNEIAPNADLLQPQFDVKGKGNIDMGLQYHFFMEPHTAVVIPYEAGFEVHSATQWMDLAQVIITNLLNVKANEVQVVTRRLGGGYGGKATKSLPVACGAALAAYHFKRPVRFVQTLESMMKSLGKRWSLYSDYEFYVNNDGKITALENKFYQECGYLRNESPMSHTALCSRNCYSLGDNYKLEGFMVRTDAPANTACRAPGHVEGIAMTENIMEHIAFQLNLDPIDVRRTNLKNGHIMDKMLDHFEKSTNYRKRKAAVKNFNMTNRWIKKGLGLSVMEYHIVHFGQFPVTVSVYYKDGSVTITHGGIEMGQGLNTKVAQVIAHDLGIPMEDIRFEASNTINGANSICTGGSIGSESLCMAIRKCCKTLNERLEPFRKDLGYDNWVELLTAAHRKNINLIASDNFACHELKPYSVCGVGLTEVEVDVLTGNYLINRVDILEDVGKSLNPNVDVGQVEGAFMMGLGYWTSEKIIVDELTGEVKTNRTWNYKPPGAKDIPIDFRIEFLPNSENAAGFMGSKATGEPAICIAVSVAFALQEALLAARKDAGLNNWVPIKTPMSPEHFVLNAGTKVHMMGIE